RGGHSSQPHLSSCNNICSWTHKPATDSKKKKKEIPEMVTLKKEIGLLSACTIIIGEAGKQAACSAPLLTLLQQKFSSRKKLRYSFGSNAFYQA
uniref:Uncharacterized protein n=1 Tax=Poecilia reticulata TaxID=8081 RepID=A0A3P9NC37_POERE